MMKADKWKGGSALLSIQYLDVELFFDEVVRCAGGYRVDSLVPENRTFENADYYFESEGVFGELKTLRYDQEEDERVKARLVKVYKDFARAGKVPPISAKQRFAHSNLLPIETQLELLRPLKRRLQTPVKKAARQLKETKRAFNREKDAGLLILVNEGSALFRPTTIFYFLHHLFRGAYSSIDHIVYCSVNVPANIPSIDGGARVWFQATIEGRQKISPNFLQLLQSCWAALLEEKLKIKMPLIKFDGPSKIVDDVVFEKIDPRVRRGRS
jgi:hypothetical protein